MKNECAKYKDLLLEAALSENSAGVLDQHLRQCGACANELAGLRDRPERLDTLLPLVLGADEPSPGFRARVLAEAESTNEASHARGPRVWVLAAAAAAVLVAALLTGGGVAAKCFSTPGPGPGPHRAAGRIGCR